MKDQLYNDFQNLGRNLLIYGTITDRTDYEENGCIITEFVIIFDAEIWNMTMKDGAVKKILKV